MKEKSSIFPVSALIAGVLILFNPNASLIDLLPDCIGYALILYSLRHISAFVPYMQEAADGFRRLFYLTLIKLPALVLMLTLASQRVTITLFSFSFAVLELVFLFPALTNFFEGLFYLGQRFGCESAILDKKEHGGASAVRTTTYVFFAVKMTLSTLPDFLLLFEYDPLSGKGFTVPMTQYAFVVGGAFLLSLIVGIVWLTYILPYLRAIRSDVEEKSLTPPDGEDVRIRENHRLRLSLPFFLFALGACLSVDLVAGNTALLPDYLSAAAFLALAIVFYLKRKQEALPSLIVSGGYLALSVLSPIFRARFFSLFTESDISASTEAAVAYIPVTVLSFLSESAFIAVFLLLIRSLNRFYRENEILDAPKNAYEARLLTADRNAIAKQNRLISILAILTGASSFISTLLAYFKEPAEPNVWQRLFLPLFTSFWLLSLVAALVLGISTAMIARSRTQELYRMWDVKRTSFIE